MPIDLIHFRGQPYPAFQSRGNSAQFAVPYARHVCRGRGVDVGCGTVEWALPEATPVDPLIPPGYTATDYPFRDLDYVFSSHCLEHVPQWVDALDYWYASLRPGGVLFLYLPDYSQVYWRPWNNRKHLNVLTPKIIEDYLTHKGCTKIVVSGVDLNSSFMAMGEK